MLNHSALSRDNGPLIFPSTRNPLALKSGYESSGDPHGRLTKDSTGRMGRLGPNRSGLQCRPWKRLADS